MTQKRIVVIGAGVGGLTAAAALAKRGADVTVLEAHIYPGGCAGTFYHRKYRFDAGATLAGGFYPGGPMDLVARATGIDAWPARPAEPAMVVHLPDGRPITRWADERRWDAYERAFGSAGRRFFAWQERTADALWALALRNPNWPPQSLPEAAALGAKVLGWIRSSPRRHLAPSLLADAVRSVSAHLRGASDDLRMFVDAQLLIAAQATGGEVFALYGAAALDLPRRGVVHLAGGMGALAQALAQATRQNGGRVLFRHAASRVVFGGGLPVAVETVRGERVPADGVIINLPPWNVRTLLGDSAPARIARLSARPRDGWGAFLCYVGVRSADLPAATPLHHQVIVREPLGEGNTVFLSLSPEWDPTRAPVGRRALTISTHTRLGPWWALYEQDRAAYEERKRRYADRLLDAASRAFPAVRSAAELILPGTPVTFQRFTQRADGWVGGLPQYHLLRTFGPRLGARIWMVGDSIFPGQSTAAVALGGLRVAEQVHRDFEA